MAIMVSKLPVDPGPAAWNELLPDPAPARSVDGQVSADFIVIGAGFAGLSYLVLSTGLGAVFLYLAHQVFNKRNGGIADQVAKRLFLFSIFYLFALYLMLLLEKLVPLGLSAIGF